MTTTGFFYIRTFKSWIAWQAMPGVECKFCMLQLMGKFGTDFQTMQKLIPGRSRSQLKGKYRRECKLDPERVDHALKGQVKRSPCCGSLSKDEDPSWTLSRPSMP